MHLASHGFDSDRVDPVLVMGIIEYLATARRPRRRRRPAATLDPSNACEDYFAWAIVPSNTRESPAFATQFLVLTLEA